MIYSKIEGSGKPLLIIHGFLGMSDNWKTLASAYVLQGFEVHVLDMRNHGRSFHSDDFSYEIMANDVLDYCNFNQIQKFDLIGHSMGGKVAMLFATNFSEMIDKLIVADIGPKFYAPHHQQIMAGLNAINFDLKPSRTEIEQALQLYIPDFGTRQFLMKNLFWKTPDQLDFRFNLRVLTEKIDQIGQALPKHSVFNKPTLFIRGGASNYILDTDLEAIKIHFPKMTVATIPLVGHWLHAENPALFLDLSAQFLSGN